MDGEGIKGSEKNMALLDNWIEQGKTDIGVAVYGTKVPFITDMLHSQHIPSYPLSHLPYQQQIASEGSHLYYMLPRVGKMWGDGSDPVMNRAVSKIIMQFPKGAQTLPHNLQEDSIHNIAKQYALEAALEDAFYRATGIQATTDEVNYLASLFAKKAFEKYEEDTHAFNRGHLGDSLKDHTDPNRIATLQQTVGQDKLRHILPDVIQKRGVLVYFNRYTFSQGKILVGHESEQEIMVVSPQPLTLDTVSGIEILSESERNELLPVKVTA